MKKRDYIIVALVDETHKINRIKYFDSIIVCHAARARWALRRLILEIVPSLPDTPSASDEHQCTAVVQGGALRHSNLYFCAD